MGTGLGEWKDGNWRTCRVESLRRLALAIRIGIVGCGLIARFHALAIAETAGAVLAGCASQREESARRFAAGHGIAVFSGPESMIASGAVDAIAVCTPSGAHLEPALMAIRAGLHVIVEKPLEVTPERCGQLIEAANRGGVRLATVFQSRFSPVWRRLKSAVDSGEFGVLANAEAQVHWFRPQSYYDSAEWRGTWRLDGGGALMNQGIHTVDLLQWIMGPVRRVSASVALRAHERIEVEDVAVACLEFCSGALGTVSVTTASFPGVGKRIGIHGAAGSAIIEEDRIVHWRTVGDPAGAGPETGDSAEGGGSGASDPAAIQHGLHAAQYADFVAAIRDQRAPFVDGVEGRRSVDLIATIYRSAREGRPIETV